MWWRDDLPRQLDERLPALPEPERAAAVATLVAPPDLADISAVLAGRSRYVSQAAAAVVAYLFDAVRTQSWVEQRELSARSRAGKGTTWRVLEKLRRDGFLTSEEGRPSGRGREGRPCQRHRLQWTAETLGLALQSRHRGLRVRAFCWLIDAGVSLDDACALVRSGWRGLAEVLVRIRRHEAGQTPPPSEQHPANSDSVPFRSAVATKRGEYTVGDSQQAVSTPGQRVRTHVRAGGGGPRHRDPQSGSGRIRERLDQVVDSPALLDWLVTSAASGGSNRPRSTVRHVLDLAEAHGVCQDFAAQLLDQVAAEVRADQRERRGPTIDDPGAVLVYRFRKRLREVASPGPEQKQRSERSAREGGSSPVSRLADALRRVPEPPHNGAQTAVAAPPPASPVNAAITAPSTPQRPPQRRDDFPLGVWERAEALMPQRHPWVVNRGGSSWRVCVAAIAAEIAAEVTT